MSVERSGQAIGVGASKGQLVTGGARGFDEGRQPLIGGTSRMNREVQVRICEGLGVKFPGSTRLWSESEGTGPSARTLHSRTWSGGVGPPRSRKKPGPHRPEEAPEG